MAQRHIDQQHDAFLAKVGVSAITPFEFFWEIMPGIATFVRASLVEIEAEAKNFSVAACACINTSTVTLYEGHKSDPFTTHFVCMQCLSNSDGLTGFPSC